MSHKGAFCSLPRSRPITQRDRRRQRAAFGDQGAASAVLIDSSLSAPCSTSDLATAAAGKEIKLQPCDQVESTSLCTNNPAYRTAASVVPVRLFLRCRMSRPKKNKKMSRPKHFYGRPMGDGRVTLSMPDSSNMQRCIPCTVQERLKVRRLDDGGHPECDRNRPLTLGKL